ncbi:uncharacterized protein BcabD6B2_46580 [Babesia caballi]|uniref:Membrane protein, putative n=1 Tax=Babesia caballi TaxID=5871 RepID=A0AAV4LZR7_BABCB|nr:membrane protein, putative [Babesia caballi]
MKRQVEDPALELVGRSAAERRLDRFYNHQRSTIRKTGPDNASSIEKKVRESKNLPFNQGDTASPSSAQSRSDAPGSRKSFKDILVDLSQRHLPHRNRFAKSLKLLTKLTTGYLDEGGNAEYAGVSMKDFLRSFSHLNRIYIVEFGGEVPKDANDIKEAVLEFVASVVDRLLADDGTTSHEQRFFELLQLSMGHATSLWYENDPFRFHAVMSQLDSHLKRFEAIASQPDFPSNYNSEQEYAPSEAVTGQSVNPVAASPATSPSKDRPHVPPESSTKKTIAASDSETDTPTPAEKGDTLKNNTTTEDDRQSSEDEEAEFALPDDEELLALQKQAFVRTLAVVFSFLSFEWARVSIETLFQRTYFRRDMFDATDQRRIAEWQQRIKASKGKSFQGNPPTYTPQPSAGGLTALGIGESGFQVQDAREEKIVTVHGSQHVLGERAQQLPANVQRLRYAAALVLTLPKELLLELVSELKVQQILRRHGLLADDSLHRPRVLANGVVGVELVGDRRVVLPGEPLADARLHETRQGRQHVDGRVNAAVVQRPVDEYLALSDVTGEIGNRVRDVVVGHGQDGELGDAPVAALDPASALIETRQVSVHVPGVPTPAGHLLPGRRHLTQGVGIGRHVGQNDKDVHLPVESQVLGRGVGEPRRHDALNGRVVGKVQEQRDARHGAVLLEVVLEEGRSFQVHTHGRKHHREVVRVPVDDVLVVNQRGLPADLRTDLVVRQAGGREERNLLPQDHRVHDVDGGNARFEHLPRVQPAHRVDGLPVDVNVLVGEDPRPPVDRLPAPVEDAPQHVLAHAHLEHVTRHVHAAAPVVDPRGALEDLHDGDVPPDLQHLAAACGAVPEVDVDDLRVLGAPHVFEDDQRPLHSSDGTVPQVRHVVLRGGLGHHPVALGLADDFRVLVRHFRGCVSVHGRIVCALRTFQSTSVLPCPADAKMAQRSPSVLFALFCYLLAISLHGRPFVVAEDDDASESDSCPANVDIFTKTTFITRVMGFACDTYLTSPLQRRGQGEEAADDADAPAASTDDADDKASTRSASSDSGEDRIDVKNIFGKYRRKPYTREEFAEKLREILKTPDPLYGTNYNREWGRACLTPDYEIPNTEYLIHFDVFDPFMPPGLLFEDLRCLHLYNVKEGYNLYKLRMGDMILTLRPDLEDASVHLFEDSWGLMVVRVLFTADGIINRHEYTETTRGSKTFHKTMGPAVHYAAPKIDTTDMNAWLEEKYRLLSLRRPPIIEEVMHRPES